MTEVTMPVVDDLLQIADGLVRAIDNLEFAYRNQGVNAIKPGGQEHPLFAELWRVAERARRRLDLYRDDDEDSDEGLLAKLMRARPDNGNEDEED
jgi:hypothetical protein